MMKRELEDAELEELFGAARRTVPEPDPAFLDTLVQDAARAAEPQSRVPTPRRVSLTEQVLAVLGGWTGMGGLAAATLAGVWIGVAPPNGLPDPLDIVSGNFSEATYFGGGLGLTSDDLTVWEEG